MNRRTARRYAANCTSTVPGGNEGHTGEVKAGASRSQCQRWRNQILGKLEAELSAQVDLSHLKSDQTYGGSYEAVYREDTETFLRCWENAFRYLGGVPVVVNLDNLKAAVLKADWYDPELNPKLADFCPTLRSQDPAVSATQTGAPR